MKKKWEMPSIDVQQFEADEYVAVCYYSDADEMTISCKVSGGYGHEAWGSDGLYHGGPCYGPINVNMTGYTGNESNQDGSFKASIYNLNISGTQLDQNGNIIPGTYNGTWNSKDGDVYSHHGTVTITGTVTTDNHS